MAKNKKSKVTKKQKSNVEEELIIPVAQDFPGEEEFIFEFEDGDPPMIFEMGDDLLDGEEA